MRNRFPSLRWSWALLVCLWGAGTPLSGQAPGTIDTIAGNGAAAFAGDNGPALQASLNNPVYVAFAPDGGYYIADSFNHRIRRVAPDGTISTVAGNGVQAFGGDGGPAVNASLRDPTGVAVDSDGNLYIADAANDRIRKVDLNGTITTIAGNGVGGFSGDGGPATAAMLDCPTRIAFDGFGNLFIADQCNHRIRRVDRNGIITTVAGSGTPGAALGGFSGDGGPATAAQFKHPTAVTIDSGGNMYITDQLNNRIRRVDRSGTLNTVAGSGVAGFSGDGGPATAAALSTPGAVAVDAAGTLYIADNVNNRIRRVGPDGIIMTIIGSGAQSSTGDGGVASAATVNNAFGISFDPFGNLFIAESGGNRIRKVFNVAPGNVPTFPSAGITNGASFRPGGTPGGAIASIFGLNLTSADEADVTPLPTELAGTSVRIGGILAPLFGVARLDGYDQINLQIPFELVLAAASSPRPTQAQPFVEVVVTSNGVSNAPVLMLLAPAQPGIFLLDGVNGAIVHGADPLQVVSAENPAARGETVVVYATGLGAVQDPPASGEPASLTSLSPTIPAFASATVGGMPARVDFSGLTPDYVGLYQVNLVVPQDAPAGSVDVVITINGAASNTAKMVVQ